MNWGICVYTFVYMYRQTDRGGKRKYNNIDREEGRLEEEIFRERIKDGRFLKKLL